MLRSIGLPELLILFPLAMLILIPFWVVPFWKIFSKAGYPGIMSLAMLVPVLNFVMLLYVAFSDWPALKKSS